MPFAELAQAMRVAAEAEADERRERLRECAFIGWQLSQSMAARPLGFGDYLGRLGLDYEREELGRMTPEQRQAERDRAIANAERVNARLEGRQP